MRLLSLLSLVFMLYFCIGESFGNDPVAEEAMEIFSQMSNNFTKGLGLYQHKLKDFVNEDWGFPDDLVEETESSVKESLGLFFVSGLAQLINTVRVNSQNVMTAVGKVTKATKGLENLEVTTENYKNEVLPKVNKAMEIIINATAGEIWHFDLVLDTMARLHWKTLTSNLRDRMFPEKSLEQVKRQLLENPQLSGYKKSIESVSLTDFRIAMNDFLNDNFFEVQKTMANLKRNFEKLGFHLTEDVISALGWLRGLWNIGGEYAGEYFMSLRHFLTQSTIKVKNKGFDDARAVMQKLKPFKGRLGPKWDNMLEGMRLLVGGFEVDPPKED